MASVGMLKAAKGYKGYRPNGKKIPNHSFLAATCFINRIFHKLNMYGQSIYILDRKSNSLLSHAESCWASLGHGSCYERRPRRWDSAELKAELPRRAYERTKPLWRSLLPSPLSRARCFFALCRSLLLVYVFAFACILLHIIFSTSISRCKPDCGPSEVSWLVRRTSVDGLKFNPWLTMQSSVSLQSTKPKKLVEELQQDWRPLPTVISHMNEEECHNCRSSCCPEKGCWMPNLALSKRAIAPDAERNRKLQLADRKNNNHVKSMNPLNVWSRGMHYLACS